MNAGCKGLYFKLKACSLSPKESFETSQPYDKLHMTGAWRTFFSVFPDSELGSHHTFKLGVTTCCYFLLCNSVMHLRYALYLISLSTTVSGESLGTGQVDLVIEVCHTRDQ